MRYVSLFSGIEAASVAWQPLGWKAVAFSDIDPFSRALLAYRYPDVPNLGDVSKIDWSDYAGSVDLVVGGSPCQAFSIAGKREGLLDDRGRLMLEYVRSVRDLRPRWVLWENVPGVLSQSNGDAFDTLQRELEQCEYSCAWRVIDAQFAGVAQRRRRVFLVGHARVGCAAAVLFERESLQWDSPSSLAKREALARGAGRLAEDSGDQGAVRLSGVGRFRLSDIFPEACDVPAPRPDYPPAPGTRTGTVFCVQGDIARGAHLGCNGVGAAKEISYTLNTIDIHLVAQPDIAYAFSAGQSKTCGSIGWAADLAPTLRASASGTNGSPTICIPAGCNTEAFAVEVCPSQTASQAKTPPIVCLSGSAARSAVDIDMCGTLTVAGDQPCVAAAIKGRRAPTIVRRLTPRECERLQGFPDDWTRIPYRGRPASECPDAPRYKACGNSMAVPVMLRIGRRIAAVDEINGIRNPK